MKLTEINCCGMGEIFSKWKVGGTQGGFWVRGLRLEDLGAWDAGSRVWGFEVSC